MHRETRILLLCIRTKEHQCAVAELSRHIDAHLSMLIIHVSQLFVAGGVWMKTFNEEEVQ